MRTRVAGGHVSVTYRSRVGHVSVTDRPQAAAAWRPAEARRTSGTRAAARRGAARQHDGHVVTRPVTSPPTTMQAAVIGRDGCDECARLLPPATPDSAGLRRLRLPLRLRGTSTPGRRRAEEQGAPNHGRCEPRACGTQTGRPFLWKEPKTASPSYGKSRKRLPLAALGVVAGVGPDILSQPRPQRIAAAGLRH